MSDTNLELLAQDLRRQRDVLAAGISRSRGRVRDLAGEIGRPSRIYIVGCGDSLNVGMAVRFEWERVMGLPVHAIPALTFSRFEASNLPADALVIALSQSGTVVRVIEAARASFSRGVGTITASASGTSPLAAEPATATLITDFPKLGFVPGTTSFPYHLAVFYELGLALAERWGTEADTGAGRANLDRLPDLVEASLEPMWATARDQAATITRDRPFLVLGTGPNFASVLFVARKLFEVPQVAGLAQETEEYAHDEYSVVTPQVPSMIIAPHDAAAKRSSEILDSLLNIGSPTAVVAERGHVPSRPATWTYEMEPGLDELYTPLLATLPGQLLTYELGRAIGGSFYATDDPIHRRDGDDLIYRSELVATSPATKE
ncbi:MAG: SIS domain-containing protein [Chloroflexi bacterium]|nr:SIS domain-containing protein [Chloroflexota bacterium]